MPLSHGKKNKILKSIKAGFTLIEFIVIISVFGILAGISFFNFNDFDSEISLSNLAHDVALTIRRTQSAGSSATDFTGGQGVRGIFFEYDPVDGIFLKTMHIFDDVDGNRIFSPVVVPSGSHASLGDDRLIDSVTIQGSDMVRSVCVGSSPNACNQIADNLVILFKRPLADAIIVNTGAINSTNNFVRISIASRDGKEQWIEVNAIGQINVVDNPN